MEVNDMRKEFIPDPDETMSRDDAYSGIGWD